MSDVNPRSTTYTVGGVAPYNFTQTPPYNPAWIPPLVGRIGGEAMSERVDYDTRAQGVGRYDAVRESYTNPPFLAVGGTATMPSRVPAWMQGENGEIRRILRGYIRREEVYGFGANATESSKRSNARLYFMYNPESIERNYQTLEQASQTLFPNTDPSGLAPFSTTTVAFTMLFDRQEEVATLVNHPGCLLDLAVFDLLARGGSPGQDTPWVPTPGGPDDIGVNSDALTLPNSASAADNGGTTESLMFDPGLILYVVFSPNLAFRGSIMAASATFEKFSHRMTPTRMELTITMRLYAIGSDPPYKTASLTDAQGASSLTAKAKQAVASADSQVAADANNLAGRLGAMEWSEHWIKGKPHPVPYDRGPRRVDNIDQDSLTNFEPPHVPNYMDCSSFVARAYHVMGLSGPLGLAGDADSREFADVARNAIKVVTDDKSDDPQWGVWEAHELKGFIPGALSKYLKPGDIIVRDKVNDKPGHVAYIHADLGGGEDEGHRFELLDHSGAEDHPYPEPRNVTVAQIMGKNTSNKPFDYVMRARPVPFRSGAGAGNTGDAPGT